MLSLHYFTFNPFQENTYILSNEEKKAILVDPGMYTPEEKVQIKNFIEEKGLELVQVILTHAHLDHVFGLEWVHKEYGLEAYLQKEDEKILENAVLSGEKYGLTFKNYDGPIHYLDEKDTIDLGEDQLSILHLPGHSPGSIAYCSEKQQFFIGGDVLFRDGIGRTDLPFGNQNQLLDSIQKKLFLLPDQTRVFPGHGPSTTIGYEKQHNPYLS